MAFQETEKWRRSRHVDLPPIQRTSPFGLAAEDFSVKMLRCSHLAAKLLLAVELRLE